MLRNSHTHHHDHSNSDNHDHIVHNHTHGAIDPTIYTTERGIWAIKWSFIGLLLTAIIQITVVVVSGSVALLADTIHNFGDAATAIPLWIAFALARLKPNKRYTYGYGRVEDLAGITIVLIILFSAIVAGFESVNRLLHPQTVSNVWAVAIAAIIGFIGNETVATFRIRVGKDIGSAALVADGYHARIDGLTSLAVLFGAVGILLGYPFADPIIGLLITIAIARIVWDSAKAVFSRLLDGVDPGMVNEIQHAITHVNDVKEVTQIRVRWLGHRLRAEVNVAVNPNLTVESAHDIAVEVQHQLLHHLSYLSQATVHIDPMGASGEEFHRFEAHEHDNLPIHSH